MTKHEFRNISKEVTYIEKRLSILSPDNPIEYQQREKLLCRLDYLEFKLDRFIASETGKHLRLIVS